MRSSSSIAVACLVAGASAAAVAGNDEISIMKRNIIARQTSRKLNKRQSVTTGADDVTVLNFALTLEHLEDAFYSGALKNFSSSDFDNAGYSGAYPVLQQVAADEAQHVSFLTTALSAAGATPVQACTYKFPYTDVKSFLAVSQVLEGVGVSAYLGAAGSINNTQYLTAAGSILTVEARHNAFIRFLNNYSPFPQPEDTPQSAASVVTVASPFFVSCPTGSAPAIAGHPAINVTSTSYDIGSTLNLVPANATALAAASNATVYCGFASGLSAGFSEYKNGSCQIPTSNVTNGQTYVFLTSGPSVSDVSVLSGPAIINLGAANTSVTLKNTGSGSGSNGSNGSGSGSSNKTGAASASAQLSVLGFAGLLAAGMSILF